MCGCVYFCLYFAYVCACGCTCVSNALQLVLMLQADNAHVHTLVILFVMAVFFYGVGIKDDAPFLVFEWMHQGALEQILAQVYTSVGSLLSLPFPFSLCLCLSSPWACTRLQCHNSLFSCQRSHTAFMVKACFFCIGLRKGTLSFFVLLV